MILYFSGTGNTRYCAQLLAEALGDTAHDISPRRRDEAVADSATPPRRIIWMFPIYSWGVPPIVADYMRQTEIPHAADVPHYMVATCGDDAGNAAQMWRDIATSRRWTPRSAYTVQMPNTYVCLPSFDVDTEAVRQAKLAAAPTRITDIARHIAQDDPAAVPQDMVVRGCLPWLKTSVIYPTFKKNGVKPRKFAATDACTGCGACARVCPMSNITMESGSPHWGGNCAMCLACYHLCPAHAVMYGRHTRAKGQYRGPQAQ